MNDIPPIQSVSQMASLASQRVGTGKPPVAPDSDGDRLEISETGQMLSALGSDSWGRADRIAEIRQSIAGGTYETPDKIDIAVSRLMDVLRSMNVTA